MELTAVKTVFICGPVASGKTHLILQLVTNKPDVLMLDTMMEFEDENYEHVWRNPQALCKILASPGHHKVIYHPGKNLLESFRWASAAYWQLETPRWLVLDECHEYTAHENFDSLMRYARKRQLGVICASQRIADVPKSVTTNSRMIIIFYSSEARDYLAVKDRFGIEAAEAMRNLRPLLYNDETKRVEQTPEVVVYQRGKPIEIHDLGTQSIRKVSCTDSEQTEDSADSVEIPSLDMN